MNLETGDENTWEIL